MNRRFLSVLTTAGGLELMLATTALAQTNCGGFDSTGPLCQPASSTVTATPNTDPTNVFNATLTPPNR